MRIIILCLIIGFAVGFVVKKDLLRRKSVYMVIDIKIKDMNLYSEYIARAPEIIKKYGGRYLARGGKITSIAGNWNPERVIIVEFDSKQKMQECFNSQEYLEIAPLREESTIGKAIVVEGYAD